MKMKKIFVTVRQFQSFSSLDVDSRLFDGDTLEPIMRKEEDKEWHLGQVSSSIYWAVQDISDQERTARQELDRRYPDGFEFVFFYMPIEFCKYKAKKWWIGLSHEQKRDKGFLDDLDILNHWVKFRMIHDAITLKPINPNNIVLEPWSTPESEAILYLQGKLFGLAAALQHTIFDAIWRIEHGGYNVQEVLDWYNNIEELYNSQPAPSLKIVE